jgi:hypothetical protein
MFLPVQIPTAIEQEGTQSGQCVAGLFAPRNNLHGGIRKDSSCVATDDISSLRAAARWMSWGKR